MNGEQYASRSDTLVLWANELQLNIALIRCLLVEIADIGAKRRSCS